MSKTTKYIIIGVILLLIIFLFRIKAITPATILSAVFGLAVLVNRLLYIWSIKNNYKRYKESQQSGGKAPQATMSAKQAREILGVPEAATKKEINAAYKKLMAKNHPDTGGSTFLAAQINEAREVLIKKREFSD